MVAGAAACEFPTTRGKSLCAFSSRPRQLPALGREVNVHSMKRPQRQASAEHSMWMSVDLPAPSRKALRGFTAARSRAVRQPEGWAASASSSDSELGSTLSGGPRGQVKFKCIKRIHICDKASEFVQGDCLLPPTLSTPFIYIMLYIGDRVPLPISRRSCAVAEIVCRCPTSRRLCAVARTRLAVSGPSMAADRRNQRPSGRQQGRSEAVSNSGRTDRKAK